jgi:hypothetical protein
VVTGRSNVDRENKKIFGGGIA